MPFVRGRYHINRVLGEAMEAAREAEAALAVLEHAAARENGEGSDEFGGHEAHGKKAANGRVHRVEIEATELVPSHTGQAARGYVARVHRGHGGAVEDTPNGDGEGSTGSSRGARSGTLAGRGLLAWSGRASSGTPAETHVFADHRDLVSFLRDELAKDCAR
jgi:hypothetical protein